MTAISKSIGTGKMGPPCILIVDDDPHVILGLKDILDDYGHCVEIATCAAEAYDHLHGKAFSVVISDYSLPDENGVQLLLEAKKRQPLLGLILMTGHDIGQIREKVDPRTLRFLRKPVEVPALLGAIDELIRHQCDNLKIDWNCKALSGIPEPVVNRPPVSDPVPLPSRAEILLSEVDVQSNEQPRVIGKWVWSVAGFALLIASFGAGWVTREKVDVVPPQIASAPIEFVAQATPEAPVIPTVAAIPPLQTEPAVPVVAMAPDVPKPARPSLRMQLSSSDPMTRLRAAKALLKSNTEHPKAIAVLVATINDPLSKLHLMAVETLSSAGASSENVITSLAAALKDEDAAVACGAATALGHLGKAAAPALHDLVLALNYHEGTVPSVILAAQNAIVGIGEPAVPALHDALDTAQTKQPLLDVLARIKPADEETTPGPIVSKNTEPDTQPLDGVDDLPDTNPTDAAAAPAADAAIQTQ